MNLSGEASEQCARGFFTMIKLQALELNEVTLDDGFFSVMSESASQSQSQIDLTYDAHQKIFEGEASPSIYADWMNWEWL